MRAGNVLVKIFRSVLPSSGEEGAGVVAILLSSLLVSACGSSNSVSGSGNTPGPLQPKAQTYYVDANEGNDEADGTSPQKAWRTVARASKQVLKAGDQLLLHRGQTFSGELDIRAEGTQAEPVLVSGYGSRQRPVVVGRDASMWAVRVLNSSHITLRGLEIINTGRERVAGRTGLKVECRDHGIYGGMVLICDAGKERGYSLGNIFYTAEPSQFNMTKTTRNLFLHNWYLGEYRQLPADAEAQTSLAGKTSTDSKALLQLMDERDVCDYNAHFPNPAKMEAFFKTLE